MADNQKKGTKWRAYASEFLGAGEVSFETFQERNKTTATDSGGAPDASGIPQKNLHPSLASSGLHSSSLQDLYEEWNDRSRQERMRALQQKMQENQRRHRRNEERRKQRDQDLVESWKKHAAEERERKDGERNKRLEELQEFERRVEEVKAQKKAAAEAREEQRKKDEEERAEALKEEERAAMSAFLTGVTTTGVVGAKMPPIPSSIGDAKDETLKPEKASDKDKGTRKARVPTMNRKKKEEGVTATQEKSMVQQLPQLFPGLRRTAGGRKIAEEPADKEMPAWQKERFAAEKEQRVVRQAQLGLMKRIAAQVLDYRRSVRESVSTQPVRLIEVMPTRATEADVQRFSINIP